MKTVIVESPAKAKTIMKYLGKDYEVLASFGHVRDLPAKDGSVDPETDFAMLWEVDTKSAKRLSDIAKSVKTSERVILATDPDREGEAISWHVLEVLKGKRVLKDTPVERVVFNAITRCRARGHGEILVPLMRPWSRPIWHGARLIISSDSLSPVLWRKLPGARIGRPGAVGRLATDLRSRTRDRELRAAGILVDPCPSQKPARRLFTAHLTDPKARNSTSSIWNGSGGRGV